MPVSYTHLDSAIESNDFSAAASSISADAIVGEDGPDSEPIPDEPEENPELKVVPPPAPVQPEPVAVQPAPEPEPIPEPQSAPAPTPAEDIQSAPVFNTKPMAQSGIPGEINAPIRKRKIFIPGHEGISGSAPASQPVSAHVPPVSQPAPAPTPVQTVQPAQQTVSAPVYLSLIHI